MRTVPSRTPSAAAIAIALLLLLTVAPGTARAQHLWWADGGDKNATCAYGQITVLATHPSTYYCGINWHPGEPAGGYCGIQHNDGTEQRTICSVWDTSATLHPSVTFADGQAVGGRFGGEGEGAHSHMLWPWKLGQTFQFYVAKTPGKKDGTTDLRYYALDEMKKGWVHVSSIEMPDGGQSSVPTISGGGMASFLENFSGEDKQVPRVALYRLWIGHSPATLKPLTTAGGDGQWGQIHGAYYLAGGDPAAVAGVFAKVADKYGKPSAGDHGDKLRPTPPEPLSPKLVDALKHLPTDH